MIGETLTTVADGLVLKLYPKGADDAAVLPWATYDIIGDVPQQDDGPGLELAEATVRITCFSKTYADAQAMSEAFRLGILQSLSAVIDDSLDDRERDTRHPSVIQTYRIWYTRAR